MLASQRWMIFSHSQLKGSLGSLKHRYFFLGGSSVQFPSQLRCDIVLHKQVRG